MAIIAACFFLSLLIMSKDAELYTDYQFTSNRIPFQFWKHLFIPGLAQIIIYFCGYISITKLVEEKKDAWAKAGAVFGLYLVLATLISVTYTYSHAWKFARYDQQEAYLNMFTDGFTTVAIIFIIYIAYYILKELIFTQVAERKVSPQQRSQMLNIFFGVVGWIALVIVFGANHAPGGAALFGVGIPFTALLVAAHLKYLIPMAGSGAYKSRTYLWRVVPIVFVLSIIAGGICAGILGNDVMGPASMGWMMFAAVIVIPACWYISRNNREKAVLQSALGSSEANLLLLRSQINPHFLFNALNTLYGTALQENAERTGEGIQKLGDMMRFMLHENMQEKISLAREVDYLNNYIDLQKLRTAASPDIIIQTNIEEQLNRLDISPMLLIPFVENAFKHGISLQLPSFINISLHTKERVLFFDVNNSVHAKNEYDPEKMKSGIGLQNVKQRLALLYPGKHELIIRESAKEFFVHLTVNL